MFGALGQALLSQLFIHAAAGDEGLDVEAVALASVQTNDLYHAAFGNVRFLTNTEGKTSGLLCVFCVTGVFEAVVVMSAAAHLASALIFTIGDFIFQLVSKDVPDALLVTVFKQRSERVSHMQRGLLFVFAHLQLEIRSTYISWWRTVEQMCFI